MLRVGLTGGIASGKSTVSRMLAEKGIPVIDADAIAREVVEPGSEGLAEVAGAFGPGVLTPKGRLDRARLGERIFSDGAERRKLESILHPRIIGEQDRRLDGLERRGEAPFAVVDAALMIESGGYRRFDVLVVVDCPEAQQIERLRARNGLDAAAAAARIKAQMPLSEKVKLADRVIDNGGSVLETRALVDSLVEWLKGKTEKPGK